MIVREVLGKYTGKPIILFLRDRDATSMHRLESVNDFNIDILERKVLQWRASVLKDVYHIELSI